MTGSLCPVIAAGPGLSLPAGNNACDDVCTAGDAVGGGEDAPPALGAAAPTPAKCLMSLLGTSQNERGSSQTERPTSPAREHPMLEGASLGPADLASDPGSALSGRVTSSKSLTFPEPVSSLIKEINFGSESLRTYWLMEIDLRSAKKETI